MIFTKILIGRITVSLSIIIPTLQMKKLRHGEVNFVRSQRVGFEHILLIVTSYRLLRGFRGSTTGQEPICPYRRHNEMLVPSLVRKDPLEEGMATHSSILS